MASSAKAGHREAQFMAPTLPFYKNILNLHGHVVTMSNYNKLQTVNRKSDCEHLILTVKSQRGFSHFMTRNNDWQRIDELSSAFSLHIFPLKNKAWLGPQNWLNPWGTAPPAFSLDTTVAVVIRQKHSLNIFLHSFSDCWGRDVGRRSVISNLLQI